MTRNTPALALLEAFDLTARLGSVTAAAEQLCLTQSAVSRQVGRLETHLNITLFHRVRNRLQITDAGADYLEAIRRPLTELREASEQVRIRARGRLRIATLPTFGSRWLLPQLRDFAERHPGVDVELTSVLGPCDLEHSGLDGAIHFGAPDWPRTHAVELAAEDLTVVGSPARGRALASTPTEADLARQPLIAVSSRAEAWPQWFRHHGLTAPAHYALSVDTFTAAMDAAEAGFGLALTPSFAAEPAIAAGLLVNLHTCRLRNHGQYYFIYSDARPLTETAGQFVTWLHSIRRPADRSARAQSGAQRVAETQS